MRKTVLMLTLLAVAPVFALHANPAVAQRVFVAAQGLDSNPCSFALPCRTFQHAHDIVAAGGEIDVLDPAGYGLLNITKAISIQGHGFSGISAPSGDAITVNAGASDKVNLNGLLLDGVGTGGNGILVNTGPSVNVLNSLIRNFTSDGIRMNSSNSTVSLTVSSTSILDNGGSGITIDPVGPNQIVSVGLNRVEMNHNANGLNVNNTHSTGGSIDVAMADSVAMKTNGVVPELPSCADTLLTLMLGSLSTMVPTPWLRNKFALVGLLRLTTKVSFPSMRPSPMTGTVIVLLISPGAKVRVPLVAW